MHNSQDMNKSKIFSNLIPFLLLLFFTFSFLYRTDLSFNQDLGRHLKLGEIIWQTHHVPTVNLFSYTNPHFPFINHHWLFEVIVYLASISIGFETLLISKIVLFLLIVSFIIILVKRTSSTLFFPITYLFLHLLRGRAELRPEIFSFLFTVLTLFILETFEKKNSKLIYFLPFISLVWVNSHIYFPVGIFLQLIFLGDLFFQKYVTKRTSQDLRKKIKTLSVTTALSVLAIFINPNLLKGAFYPFTVFGNYGVTITENQTIFTLQGIHFVNPDFLFFYLAAFIVLLSIYISFWRTKFSFKNIVLSLLGLAFALQSIRGFPYLALISLPYVLLNFNYTISTVWTKSINIIVAILLLLEGIFYLNGGYYAFTYKPYVPTLTFEQYAKPAVDFILKNNLQQPIFNNFDIGSYLIYRGYPNYKVFIDGRPEAYPAGFFTKTYLPMQENYAIFKKEASKRGFKTVIFSISDENPRTLKFLNAITRDPEWKIVFLDQFMIVLTKTDIQQQLGLPTIDLSKLDVNEHHYSSVVAYTSLSIFLFNTHHLEQSKVFTQKALALSPDNPAANKAMAYILYFENRKDPRIHEYLSKSSNGVFW